MLLGGLGLGGDVACLGQSDLGKQRAYQLVDQDGEQDDVTHQTTDAGAHLLLDDDGHTQRNARLGEQRNAQILDDIGVALGPQRAGKRADVLTDATENDIHDTDENDDTAGKDGQLQLRATEHEEQNVNGHRPLVRFFHQLLCAVTDVAEDGTQHHANQKRRESDVYAADLKLDHRQGNRHQNEGDGQAQTLGVGLEVVLHPSKQKAQSAAQDERADDLNHGEF